MAATYGWPARRVETELTDEILMLYLDEATDRLAAHAQGRFDSMVEAVRAGSIFAQSDKQYRKWQSRTTSKRRGLTGMALERAVMALARAHPEYVVVEAQS